MAGVKGRSGGRREGAGRKPAEPAVTPESDPLEFLRLVWQGVIEANANQVRAASAALPFVHAKKGEPKKEASKPSGRFAVKSPPKLVVNN